MTGRVKDMRGNSVGLLGDISNSLITFALLGFLLDDQWGERFRADRRADSVSGIVSLLQRSLRTIIFLLDFLGRFDRFGAFVIRPLSPLSMLLGQNDVVFAALLIEDINSQPNQFRILDFLALLHVFDKFQMPFAQVSLEVLSVPELFLAALAVKQENVEMAKHVVFQGIVACKGYSTEWARKLGDIVVLGFEVLAQAGKSRKVNVAALPWALNH